MDSETFIPCIERGIINDAEAEALAININPDNTPVRAPVSGDLPARLALLKSRKWSGQGVRLTVGFLDNPEPAVRAKILSHMNAWNEFCNVLFTEIPAGTSPWSAQVRIARNQDDPSRNIVGGFWSYLGTEILNYPGEPTMNLEGFDRNMPESEYRRVVRHETGHTLGFHHEHLRKEIVEWIDPDKAIAYFGRPPNSWDEETTKFNVLTALDPKDLTTTATADVHSIMCYALPRSIMRRGAPNITGGTDFTEYDKSLARTIYPKSGTTPSPPGSTNPPIIVKPPTGTPSAPPANPIIGRIPAWDPVNDVPEFGEPIGRNEKGPIINRNTVPVATEAVDITTSGGHVYQLCADGSIWRYTFVADGGSPTSGPQYPTTWAQVSDANDGATVQIVADDQRLYKRLNSGAIFAIDARNNDGWVQLDNNSKTVDVIASGGNIYQRRTRGVRSEVLRYKGTADWELLDENPDTVQVVADGDKLYKRSKTGEVSVYTGTPLSGWNQVSNTAETVEIAASGGRLYQRQAGKALAYQGAEQGWEVIGEDPEMAQIVADGEVVYERQKSGRVFMSIGKPIQEWQQLDGNFSTQTIAAANGHLYQMHQGGRVLKFSLYEPVAATSD